MHRLVRISPFDQAARRHTSFASVYVWPELPEDVDIQVEDKDLRIDTYRSSGAGGQHVNVTDSAVRITHLPTGIVVSCQNERSQHRNRDSAMKVLKARLYDLKMKENQAKLDQISGAKKDIAFGSQIRSYVLHPYQLVKDHRTKEQVGDVNRVLDGDIDVFIKTYLMKKSSGTLGEPAPDDDDDCGAAEHAGRHRRSWSPSASSAAASPGSCGSACSRTTSASDPTPTRSTPRSASRISCRTCSAKARCRRRSSRCMRRSWRAASGGRPTAWRARSRRCSRWSSAASSSSASSRRRCSSIALIAPGFTGAKRELTIEIVRILFPGAGLLVLSAWCLGVLNSHHRFLLSYAAPVVWNAAMIATLLVGSEEAPRCRGSP